MTLLFRSSRLDNGPQRGEQQNQPIPLRSVAFEHDSTIVRQRLEIEPAVKGQPLRTAESCQSAFETHLTA